ncbi:MAG: hypothetical protein QM757_28215 [Paludibaculum sp.]
MSQANAKRRSGLPRLDRRPRRGEHRLVDPTSNSPLNAKRYSSRGKSPGTRSSMVASCTSAAIVGIRQADHLLRIVDLFVFVVLFDRLLRLRLIDDQRYADRTPRRLADGTAAP